MIARILILIVCLLAGGFMVPFADEAAGANGRSLLRACWAPDQMAVRAGEQIVQRSVAASGPVSLRTRSTTTQPLAPGLQGAIRRVTLPRGQKLAALTFDFCEQPGEIAGYDGAIVDYLRANGIKATLFVGGKWMTTHAARTQQLMADPLFEIASHGLHHRNVRLLGGAELAREIEGPSVLYARARGELGRAQCVAANADAFADIPAQLKLFRFPFGACHADGLKAAADAGLLSIQWDVSTGDPAPSQSAQAIADVLVRQTRPGSIILAHGNGRGVHTAEALPLAIPRLKAMGYRFVTVSELLAAGRPEIAPTCYDSKVGDTDKYDTLFRRPAAAKSSTIDAGQDPLAVPR